MLNIAFAFLGLVVGVAINALADDLPRRVWPRRPHCYACGRTLAFRHWLALGRLAQGNPCSDCQAPLRRRAIMVELATAALFALLPSIFSDPPLLAFTALYVAILILVIVIDVEHRLILHVVTFPTTTLALVASLIMPGSAQSILSSLIGALAGFAFFYAAYWFGQRLFGPEALGFGDVTLSMMMGAMLGFDRIIFALVLGILFGGAASLLLLLRRRHSLHSTIAYGPYLATAGILMLLWGKPFIAWYLSSS